MNLIVSQVLPAVLLQLARAAGYALAVLVPMVGILGLFIGWDVIRRAVSSEYAAGRDRARQRRERQRKRFEREHPGLALVFGEVAYKVRRHPEDGDFWDSGRDVVGDDEEGDYDI